MTMVNGENSKDNEEKKEEEDQSTKGIWEVKRSKKGLRIEEKKYGEYDCPKIVLSDMEET